MAELKYDIVPENAPRFAADIVGVAKKHFDVTLDYSVNSLADVDQVIGGFHEEGLKLDDVAAMVFGFGCYVGEIFVRHAGATWRAATQEEIENYYGVPLIVVLTNDTTANPIGKIIKRLEEGDEHDLPYFYRGMCRTARDGVPRAPTWWQRLLRKIWPTSHVTIIPQSPDERSG
jgi:hypothetical protein